ncbi:MAG: putative Ig domain-containing protein [Candidatus Schekmanbacteria bacterium]|nr:putative Ig domain-containing protein [Candidatus Schekmanbacteria bacterium]
MKKNWLGYLILFCFVTAFSWGIESRVCAQTTQIDSRDSSEIIERMENKITASQRKAAAQRAAEARAAAEKSKQDTTDTKKSDKKKKSKKGKKKNNKSAKIGVPGTMDPGGTPDYFGIIPNWANSPLPSLDGSGNVITGTGIRKFVDTLPGLGAANANNLGQYIPVAIPDTTTYPGSDYYEIELVEYTEQMHSDLPATKLRGYRQTNTTDATVSVPHYLGPLIIAQKDRPTRIKFTNGLPTGSAGNLFIPVDTTVMGAGMGPDGTNYTENRATLHLHGGLTPWISDGTPHQWTVPAGESTTLPTGVSTQSVPDMPLPSGGSMTFYYPNQQSARLMFYHDHAYGITRLNVYAGEAAGYLLQDTTEQDLVSNGIIPADQIPLIIQDKTFVPDTAQLAEQDPTWDIAKYGGLGSLWFPHVYMPNQNPYDLSGANAMGRWDYGPLFWPVFSMITNGPVANPLFGTDPVEPPENPGTPNPSLTPEAFMDTPVVNGTVYPTVTLQPQAYRFRILNACNDRFLNLQLYTADPSVTTSDGRTNTEVKMVEAFPRTGLPALWPKDARDGGVPDPATAGPDIIQIGTEGGFLPAPVVIPAQPVNYEYNRRNIVVLNIINHSLFLGPAERADTIIDFSAFAGKTLILYNDAPAPVPAFDPRIDYYTDDPDQTDTGGAPTTLAGYGPNTRTIMQINVAAATPAAAFNMTDLENAFKSTASTQGVFASSQDPIIVPQAAYNSTYNTTVVDKMGQTCARIQDTSMTFTPMGSSTPLTIQFQPKAIQELFEMEYGRMNATLGVELPFTNSTNQTTIPLGYIDPTTETLTDSITPLAPAADDGTQIWKITHNGVDTHAVHFHLFNVQVLNRVGWDGAIRLPDPEELGWKETVKMNPLEDIIVAMRPIAPALPFGVPESIRPMDVTRPVLTTSWASIDPITGFPTTVINDYVNFGWEYVWHCHLLGHEENDMMRPISFNVIVNSPNSPSTLKGTATVGPNIILTWKDPTPSTSASTLGNPKNEIGYRVERANGSDPFAIIGTALANATTYTDTSLPGPGNYSYRVTAYNAAGDSLPSDTATLSTLVLTTTSLPTGVIGIAYNQTLGVSGGTSPYTWTKASGSFPTGIIMDSSGAISGTPSATGTFSFTLNVSDSAGLTSTQSLSIKIVKAPSITTSTLPSATVGKGYTTTVVASGGVTPYVSWTIISGALPDGLKLTLKSSGGGITGTPTAPGTFDFTVQVTDGMGNTASKALSITVGVAPLSVTTTSINYATKGKAYYFTLKATGGVASYTWALTSGSLPSGLTLSTTGVISGTPTVKGTFTFTVQATDTLSTTANSGTLTLKVY